MNLSERLEFVTSLALTDELQNQVIEPAQSHGIPDHKIALFLIQSGLNLIDGTSEGAIASLLTNAKTLAENCGRSSLADDLGEMVDALIESE
jgi:hypothetical protein